MVFPFLLASFEKSVRILEIVNRDHVDGFILEIMKQFLMVYYLSFQILNFHVSLQCYFTTALTTSTDISFNSSFLFEISFFEPFWDVTANPHQTVSTLVFIHDAYDAAFQFPISICHCFALLLII